MALWQQILVVSSVTLVILASRVAPEYLYDGSIWKTMPILFMLQSIPYLIYSIIVQPLYLSPLRKLPQVPGGSLFMGQFSRISREPTGDPMKEWIATIPNDGLINYRMAFNSNRLLITNPKALAEVLQHKSYDFVKPEQVREGLGRILGVGILLAEGDEHKRQRRNLNPAFAFRHVKDLYPVFWAKGVEMARAINSAISTPSTEAGAPENPSPETEKPPVTNIIEVGEYASRTTLDIIGLAGMGQDFNALADPTNPLFRTYRQIFQPSRAARILGILSLILPPRLLQLLPIRRNDDVRAASATIKSVARDLIQGKKVAMEKGTGQGVDILSVALGSGGFSDEDLVNQLMTFLAAGHETTASSMMWAVLQICRKPSVQARLRDELRNAGIGSPLAGGQGQVTSQDLEKVPYLAAVVNEVLRLNPPVALTLRSARCDTSVLGQHVPKGTTVVLCPLAVNRSKELWGEDAEEFEPGRWMKPGQSGSGGAKSAYSFMTFLHGPRSCIGSGFARAEFAALLATWVSAFETELEDGERVIEIAGGITSKPKGGLRVKLTPLLEC